MKDKEKSEPRFNNNFNLFLLHLNQNQMPYIPILKASKIQVTYWLTILEEKEL